VKNIGIFLTKSTRASSMDGGTGMVIKQIYSRHISVTASSTRDALPKLRSCWIYRPTTTFLK